jgi:hypothetical protein
MGNVSSHIKAEILRIKLALMPSAARERCVLFLDRLRLRRRSMRSRVVIGMAAPFLLAALLAGHLSSEAARERPGVAPRGANPRLLEVSNMSDPGRKSTARPEEDDHVYIGMYRHPRGGTDRWEQIRQVFDQELGEYVAIHLFGLPKEERLEIVQRLARDGHPLMLLGQYPGWHTFAGKPEQYSAEEVSAWRGIAGDLLLGLSPGEMDSSGLNPIWDGQKTRWVDGVTMGELEKEGKYSAPGPNRATRRELREGWVKILREGADQWRRETGVKLAHHCGVLWHAAAAEAGVDIIGSEIGENIPAVSMMLASNRGAARHHGLPILADMSAWWVGDTPPKAGHTPYFCTACYLLALFGGAKYIQYEVDWSVWDEAGKPATRPAGKLTPWGEGLRSFYRLYRHIGKPGETVTPLAILVGRDSGWPGVGWKKGDVRGTGIWDGIHGRALPVSPRDWSLKYLNMFFPGFERVGRAPEYPGQLTASPFGQLDWITDDASAEFLRRYRAVFSLGYHAATPATVGELAKYVEGGGILFLGDDTLLTEEGQPLDDPAVEKLIGAKIGRELFQVRAVGSWLPDHDILPSGPINEWGPTIVREVEPTRARVLAEMSSRPLLLENRIGKGRCFFATPTHLVGCSQEAPAPEREPYLRLKFVEAAIAAIARRYGDGVSLQTGGGIEHYLCEKAPGTHWLLIMNHGQKSWRGGVFIEGEGVEFQLAVVGDATDWQEPTLRPGSGQGPDAARASSGKLELELPSEHYAIVRVTGKLRCCAR